MRAYAAWLFALAAAFNAAVGLALLLGRPLVGSALGLDPIAGSNLALLYLVAGFILIFAYAYLRIALDPVGSRPLVQLGAIGKLVAFASVITAWAQGAVGPRLPGLAAGDLVFAPLCLDS